MEDLSVCIPSRGECPTFVEEIKRQAARSGVEVIVIYDKLYGEALKEAIGRASREFIITMDADGQHSWDEVHRLYEARRLTDADLVIGERRVSERFRDRILGVVVELVIDGYNVRRCPKRGFYGPEQSGLDYLVIRTEHGADLTLGFKDAHCFS